MNPLASTDLLRAWEIAAAAPPALRGAALIAAICGLPFAEVSELPLGEITRRLLVLREAQFGDALTALVDCPQCSQTVELQFRTPDLDVAPASHGPIFANACGGRLELRLPTSRDLYEAIVPGEAGSISRRRLFQRCVVAARDVAGEKVAPEALDLEAEASAATALAEADPRADLELGLRCPHCRHEWTAPFDPAACFFVELSAEARRLLGDVHELAMAYGWSESEILALTPARRAAYLELVRG